MTAPMTSGDDGADASPENDLAARLAGEGSMRTVEAGTTLVTQGSTTDAVYLVIDGLLEITAEFAGVQSNIMHCGPNQLVGEVASLAKSERTATVTALERTTLREISGEAFRTWLDGNPEASARIQHEAIRRTNKLRLADLASQLFGDAAPALVPELIERVRWIELTTAEELFAEGDEADAVYFVVSGRLEASTTDREGARIKLGPIGRNEIVGETGLLREAARSASVHAVRDTTVARLDKVDFDTLLTDHPAIVLPVTRHMVARLGDALRPQSAGVRSVGIIVAAPDPDGSLIDELAALVDEQPGSIALTSTSVGLMLGEHTDVHISGTELGGARLERVLHDLESAYATVAYLTADARSGWARRVVQHTDCVVTITSESPDREELGRIAEGQRLTSLANIPNWLAVTHPPHIARPSSSAGLQELGDFDEVHHLRTGRTSDLRRVLRLASGRGTGLVLGGGGARGFAHLGVMQALRELDVPIDRIGGSSMGAIFASAGGLFEDPDEMIEMCRQQFKRVLDYTPPVVSIVKAKRITDNLVSVFGDAHVEDVWIPLYCVSTNLTTARSEIHRDERLVDAIRASIAIPGVMPPVPRGRHLLVDGGVLNNLPADVMRADPSISTVIAVDVVPQTGPRARGDYGHHVSGWKALGATIGRKRSPYPTLSSILMRTMIAGSENERNTVINDGTIDLYLSIPMRGVGLFDFDEIDSVVGRGYDSALPKIREWRDHGTMTHSDDD